MVSETFCLWIQDWLSQGSLNPCFNGRWSPRYHFKSFSEAEARLNPCFNGRWSPRSTKGHNWWVGDCLNPCFNGRWSPSRKEKNYELLKIKVLILVLMEDGLRVQLDELIPAFLIVRLNPCFNGRWSPSLPKRRQYSNFVLGLNPCFNGRWSPR